LVVKKTTSAWHKYAFLYITQTCFEKYDKYAEVKCHNRVDQKQIYISWMNESVGLANSKVWSDTGSGVNIRMRNRIYNTRVYIRAL
jgi:hypothetical protein